MKLKTVFTMICLGLGYGFFAPGSSKDLCEFAGWSLFLNDKEVVLPSEPSMPIKELVKWLKDSTKARQVTPDHLTLLKEMDFDLPCQGYYAKLDSNEIGEMRVELTPVCALKFYLLSGDSFEIPLTQAAFDKVIEKFEPEKRIDSRDLNTSIHAALQKKYPPGWFFSIGFKDQTSPTLCELDLVAYSPGVYISQSGGFENVLIMNDHPPHPKFMIYRIRNEIRLTSKPTKTVNLAKLLDLLFTLGQTNTRGLVRLAPLLDLRKTADLLRTNPRDMGGHALQTNSNFGRMFMSKYSEDSKTMEDFDKDSVLLFAETQNPSMPIHALHKLFPVTIGVDNPFDGKIMIDIPRTILSKLQDLKVGEETLIQQQLIIDYSGTDFIVRKTGPEAYEIWENKTALCNFNY